MNIFGDISSVDTLQGELLYKVEAISVFDHWLSREESLEYLQEVGDQEQAERDQKHLRLVEMMLERWESLTFKRKGRGRKSYYMFKEFCDKNEVMRYVSPENSRRSSLYHFKLVFPEIESIYIQGFDDTNYLYHKEGEGVSELLRMAENCGLHVLDVNS